MNSEILDRMPPQSIDDERGVWVRFSASRKSSTTWPE